MIAVADAALAHVAASESAIAGMEKVAAALLGAWIESGQTDQTAIEAAVEIVGQVMDLRKATEALRRSLTGLSAIAAIAERCSDAAIH